MTRIDQLKQAIESLSPADHAALRAWFEEREEQLFDEKIESTVKAGKLDKFAAEALAEHRAGKTRKL